MRITQASTYRTLLTNINHIDNDIFNLRMQGTTWRKLNKPSDDPSVIGPVLETRNEIKENAQFLKTLGAMEHLFAAADTQMDSVEDKIVEAKVIGLAGVNDTYTADDRRTLAFDVGEIINEMVRIGNTKLSGEYVFGGYRNEHPPFVKNPNYDPATFDENDSNTWPVFYNGENHIIKLEVAPGEMLEGNATGNELFMGVAAGDFTPNNPPPAQQDQPSPGMKNIFNTLAKLQRGLATNDMPYIADIQAELDTAAEQNRNTRSVQGVRAKHVDSSMDKLMSAQTDLNTILSRYQDADTLEVYSDLTRQQSALKSALQVTGKVSQLSLLDYL